MQQKARGRSDDRGHLHEQSLPWAQGGICDLQQLKRQRLYPATARPASPCQPQEFILGARPPWRTRGHQSLPMDARRSHVFSLKAPKGSQTAALLRW